MVMSECLPLCARRLFCTYEHPGCHGAVGSWTVVFMMLTGLLAGCGGQGQDVRRNRRGPGTERADHKVERSTGFRRATQFADWYRKVQLDCSSARSVDCVGIEASPEFLYRGPVCTINGREVLLDLTENSITSSRAVDLLREHRGVSIVRLSKSLANDAAVLEGISALRTSRLGIEVHGQLPAAFENAPGRPWSPRKLVRKLHGKIWALGIEPDIDDTGLEDISHIDHLVLLDLSRSRVSDRGLSNLKRARNLVSLSFGPCDITDHGLGQMGRLPGLRFLSLSGTLVENPVRALQDSSSLRALGIWNSSVRDVDLKDIGRLHRLAILRLGKTLVTNDGLRHLLGLRGLRELDIYGTSVDDGGMASIAQLANLRELDLGGTGITDIGLRLVGRLHKLKSLSMNATGIKGTGLVWLKNLTHLRSLDLSQTDISDSALETLQDLPNIRRLDLSQTKVSDKGVRLLVRKHALNGVVQQTAHRTNNVAQAAAGLPNLKSLDIAYTRVTDAGLMLLTGLTNLRCLEVGSRQITDRGLQALRRLKSLRKLVIRQSSVTRSGIRSFEASHPGCRVERYSF